VLTNVTGGDFVTTGIVVPDSFDDIAHC